MNLLNVIPEFSVMQWKKISGIPCYEPGDSGYFATFYFAKFRNDGIL